MLKFQVLDAQALYGELLVLCGKLVLQIARAGESGPLRRESLSHRTQLLHGVLRRPQFRC